MLASTVTAMLVLVQGQLLILSQLLLLANGILRWMCIVQGSGTSLLACEQ